MSKTVSVCIPAYNQTILLRKTLESVFIQNFTDYEVIIADDSSDDSVALLVEELSSRHAIRYYRNPQPKGSPENWNYVVSLAEGEMIKLLHHDDWFSSADSLSLFVQMLEADPSAEFAFSANMICDAEGRSKYVNRPTRKIVRRIVRDPSSLFPRNIVGNPSATIYRRKIETRFDPNLKWVVDMDFYYSVFFNGNTVQYTQMPLICTTDGAAHQVTSQCLDNREIELFEWLYFARRIEETSGALGTSQVLFIAKLLRKHGISHGRQLTTLLPNCPLPEALWRALKVNRFVRGARRIAALAQPRWSRRNAGTGAGVLPVDESKSEI